MNRISFKIAFPDTSTHPIIIGKNSDFVALHLAGRMGFRPFFR